MLCVNKNLWNRGATAAFDHLFTLSGIAIDRQLLKTHALAAQQCFCTMAIRAGFFGIDFNIGHKLAPVFYPEISCCRAAAKWSVPRSL
ncbi:hypothetical protein i14_4098 [Escherichia coli str. 'clone D i14']|uniref:Uncharacterized protein n=1 Tax=Escherichia coli O6:H1 (strain CFT073 / ATCC 700928 / UPEC) TaxID=199310 RepID=A0A0H2VDL0_ECOL6|nr:Hypothetical protein c4434 [Escherichia coli CFT073]AER86624.1 hypothetical protein i02_4098 [Escherichia coli str. 'clone D i2']AER91543.1 hypothetical protein i14_4098 [Escherichia coli str. 'clone D i14']